MEKKNKIALGLVGLVIMLALGVVFLFMCVFPEEGILEAADYNVVFDEGSTLSGRLFVYKDTVYLLVITDMISKKMEGYFIDLSSDDYFIGEASFNPASYKPFWKYAETGLCAGIEPTSPLGRFAADFKIVDNEIKILIKGRHEWADMQDSDAEKYLLYRQNFKLVNKAL